ncbi:MAG: alkaline phosphatase family protein [Rufibacter sp.]
MRRFFLSIAFAVLVVLSGFGQTAKHVVLISIDGLRPDFYLDKNWPAPNLQKLLAKGTYATGVNSVFPSVTYPAHTTLITGATPGKHQVYYNEIQDAPNGEWYWESKYIKVPTLWEAVKQKGFTSGAIMWPVSVGAPIDYNFPPRRPNKDEKGDQLAVTRPVVTPATLLVEMEKATGTKLTANDLKGPNQDRTTGLMANHIITRHKPNLMAIHFLEIDHAGHDYGRDHKHVREAVALVDSLVGNVLATIEKAGLKDKTAILITGDHGMVSRTTSLAPNVWLAQNGLLGKDGWKAKFVPTGGSAFLYLKDKKDKATLQKVKQILASVPPEQKKMFRVIDRKQLDAVGADSEPVLALSFASGVAYGGAQEGEAVRKTKPGGSHGHFPDFQEIQTGFIATGVGINQGVKVQQMSILDVAPLVSKLLGLDFNAPDGKLHQEILKK